MAPKMMKEYTDLQAEKIVGAAWECFCTTGYGKTTMRDIARRMNASTGVIYNYFKGKQEVLETLLAFSTNRNEHLFREISEGNRGLNAIKAAFTTAFESVPLATQLRNSKGNIGLWMEALQNEKIKKLLNRFYETFQGHFRRYLKQAIRNGEISDTFDVESLSRYYLALFMGLQVQQVLLDGTTPTTHIKNITRMLFAQDSEGSGQRRKSAI